MSERNFRVVGTSAHKVDGLQLVTGAPAFADDFPRAGQLVAKILRSPHAHARIKRIDAAKARALPGVAAVLTHEDVGPGGRFARVAYTRAGQDHPEPSPWDYFLLDDKVRFVGDRVAAVAAESEAIAERALRLIEVDYELLPALLTPEAALAEGAPAIHDEPDALHIKDAARNLCAGLEVRLRDVEAGFAAADVVLEGDYRTHRMQHAQLELHTTLCYFDAHGRLTVLTSTQVPFHVRRTLARVLGLPVGRIRVIKPRIGGGFGGKQEILIEDICAALCVAAQRPVRLELTRFEDLTAARCRHPFAMHIKLGAKRDGTLTAAELDALVDAGAYGSHSSTVPTNTANKNFPRYRLPNVRYAFEAVYTNLTVGGAMRGYGTTQGAFALESTLDELAERLGIDPVALRLRTTVRAGDLDELSPHIYEFESEPSGEGWPIQSCGLERCLREGAERFDWAGRRAACEAHNAHDRIVRRGVGMACLSQGSGVAGIDEANATVKLNEDGSAVLMIGASDLGTGADTVLAQIVAETLGLNTDEVTVYATDTDLVPYDSGAYASSTTYVSGGAALKAAQEVRDDVLALAAILLEEPADALELADHRARSRATDRSLPLAEVAMHALYVHKEQIEHTARHLSPYSPPPFAAVFAEIAVDTETGVVAVEALLAAVDAGTILNPKLARGQVAGALHMGLGFALTEELVYDEAGRPLNHGLGDYRTYKADGMPKLSIHLVETYEPTGPYGAKSIAEIPVNGPAPAIGNALKHALGVRLTRTPFTPERVLEALGTL